MHNDLSNPHHKSRKHQGSNHYNNRHNSNDDSDYIIVLIKLLREVIINDQQ